MNIMDKDTYLEIYNSIKLNRNLDKNKLVNLLYDYCISTNRDKQKSEVFISILLNNPHILSSILDRILNHYKSKYEIVEVYSKQNNHNQRNFIIAI